MRRTGHRGLHDIVMVKALDADWGGTLASPTVTVKVVEPTSGEVPVRFPEVGFKTIPRGVAPEVTEKVYGVTPPLT